MAQTGSDIEEPMIVGCLFVGVGLLILMASQSELGRLRRGRHQA